MIAGLAAGVFIITPNQTAESNPASAESSQTQQYTCGMHPEIVSDEPGYCPICGMKLTPKKDGSSVEGTVKIDPTTRQNMNLVTQPARYGMLSKSVRAFGKIDYAEPKISSVNLKVEGWVEHLDVAYEGADVRRGQTLLEIYSPKLVAAQKELMVAYETTEPARFAGVGAKQTQMNRFLESARSRLRNWDITDDQIERLLQYGEITRTLKIKSPVSGIVVSKMVDEGDRVRPGTALYRVADLAEVWVIANIYEQDLPFVEPGQNVNVTFPNIPGEMRTGEISYISPYLDSKGQIEIRVDLDNTDRRLRPEMYAEVEFKSSLDSEELIIPRRAIINSGAREIVFVASADGAYSPRVVTTGAVGAHDMIAVDSGLAAGEEVVTSGQFLLDSESRLNEALAMGGHQHGSMASYEEMSEESSHEGHDHATHDHSAEADTSLSGVYTCPMPSHFDVVQYDEGDCPKCGMALVPIEETENEGVYICPMRECGVAQKGEGRCPKCGMFLKPLDIANDDSEDTDEAAKEEDADISEEEMSGVYTCPMPSHFDIVQYGEGDCPECGMKLVNVEQTENTEVWVCPMRECGVAAPEEGSCPVCGMNLVRLELEESDDR